MTNEIATLELCQIFLREKRLLGLKESSLSTYSYAIESQLLPNLPKNSAELTEQSLYDALELLAGKFARKTLTDITLLLNDILKLAEKRKHIDKIIKLPYPSPKRKEVVIFTSQEQEILEEYLFSNMNHFNFGVLLTLYTGIRVGELSALKKKNICNLVLRIRKTMQRIKNLSSKSTKKTIIVTTEPKTEKSIRDIPLQEFLNEIIEKLEYSSPECYVLTGNEKYIEPRSVERKFKEILKACSIKYKKFHVLRHTFATNAVKSGFDIKTLSEILGHSNVKITLELYVHSDFFMKKINMKKMIPKSKIS